MRDARIVRVEVRLRHHRDDLAGVHVGDDTGCGLRLEFIARRDQLLAQRVLRAQIDGQIDRTLQLVGCKPRHVQRGEPLPVEPLLDAGDALVVDVHVADLVRNDRPVWIDALVLGQEADARDPEPMNLALLAGRDLALEPDETALRRQALAHLVGVEIRQDGGQQFNRFVNVDDLARLCEQRRRLHVGGDDLAVTVENVGARRRNRILRDAAAATMALADRRKHHQAKRDDGKNADESYDRQPEPRL